MSLNRKLIINFALLIIFSILITSFISNIMINNKFENYLHEEHKIRLENIKNEINNLYLIYGEDLSDWELSKSSNFIGFYIEVRDNNDEIVCKYDGQNYHHKGRMKGKMGHNMANMYDSDYIQENYPLLDNNENVIGNLIIGYYDNSRLTKGAQLFKSALSQSLFISAIITIILGFLLSIFLSQELSSPLVNITNTAKQMTKGNLTARTNVKTNTKEITDLANSINYLAETLQKQDTFRKKYTTEIAHELRTPLTTLKTHVEAIIDGIWKPTEENLQILNEEIDHLTQLVNNLRDTSKIEETQLNLNKSNFNISKETEKIITSFIPMFEKENCTISSNIEPDIIVFMDIEKYRQIVYNLISNSLKYLKYSGKVVVSLKRESQNIIINIEDNGIGINEQELPYIFERFYRSDTTINKKISGSGLGLAITKSLVEAHDGEIMVESKLNIGTKFTIKFPK